MIGQPVVGDLSFYQQQRDRPYDFYFTVLRNPVDMFISFFHYVAQYKRYPSQYKCLIGWESVFENKKTPLRFARLHYDLAESSHIQYFVPTISNASIPLREWALWRHMQALPAEYRKVLHPWISDFPKKQYLKYLDDDKSFPERFRCQQHVEASVLLLERYATVGTLERLSDTFRVFHHRANVSTGEDITRVVNRSRKSRAMSPEIEREIREELKAVMFCQTLLWRMAGEIIARDLECIE